MRNIVPNLVYGTSGHAVKRMMVAGDVLVRDGMVLTANKSPTVPRRKRKRSHRAH